MNRIPLLLVSLAAALVLAAPAAAKDGVQARVTTPIPADASPGDGLHVAWRLDFLDRSAKYTPFNAVGVFVRLRSASTGASTIAFATATAHADGRYDATVTVPKGGIGRVEIGLRGTTDVVFPLIGDPLVASTGGDGGGVARAVWLAPAVALLGLVALLLALRRRRPAARGGLREPARA
jgi:hypothetical protein